MAEIGYHLSTEEHPPNNLVRYARRAEKAGFQFALISDHYHPWLERQGQAPFVWSVIGGIAHATQHLRLGTGVTCPTVRIHPAILAQAAATAAAMMPGRFFFGVGTGENLNEHVLGDHWPPPDMRLEMLEEAIEIIRLLWQGENESFYGNYYIVEDARLYTLPDEPPPLMMASGGPISAELAGRISDGLISVVPRDDLLQHFKKGGGAGKPCYGKIEVCWAPTVEEAERLAYEIWPTAAIQGALMPELRTPELFEEAARMVTREQVAEKIVCGPHPEQHLSKIRAFREIGYDHIYIHQIGPHQEAFFQFYKKEILPELRQDS